jgi:hypothetical protein
MVPLKVSTLFLYVTVYVYEFLNIALKVPITSEKLHFCDEFWTHGYYLGGLQILVVLILLGLMIYMLYNNW